MINETDCYDNENGLIYGTFLFTKQTIRHIPAPRPRMRPHPFIYTLTVWIVAFVFVAMAYMTTDAIGSVHYSIYPFMLSNAPS